MGSDETAPARLWNFDLKPSIRIGVCRLVFLERQLKEECRAQFRKRFRAFRYSPSQYENITWYAGSLWRHIRLRCVNSCILFHYIHNRWASCWFYSVFRSLVGCVSFRCMVVCVFVCLFVRFIPATLHEHSKHIPKYTIIVRCAFCVHISTNCRCQSNWFRIRVVFVCVRLSRNVHFFARACGELIFMITQRGAVIFFASACWFWSVRTRYNQIHVIVFLVRLMGQEKAPTVRADCCSQHIAGRVMCSRHSEWHQRDMIVEIRLNCADGLLAVICIVPN